MAFDPHKSTLDERKAFYPVCKAIKNTLEITWEAFFRKAGISVGDKFEDNLRKGNIGINKFVTLYEWVVAHHLGEGVRRAPEIFDASQLSNWDNFLKEKGEWHRADVHILEELSLTAQSHNQPKSKTHLRLGQDFCFWINSAHAGLLIGFENYKGNWHPMPLGVDGGGFVTPVQEGKQRLPIDPKTGVPIALSDTEHDGLHGYVFIIGSGDLIAQIGRMLHNNNAIQPELLKRIAHSVKAAQEDSVAVYRLNVLFTS